MPKPSEPDDDIHEATRVHDTNLWILTPDELNSLHEDAQIESISGEKTILAQLHDVRGNLVPRAVDLHEGHTPWGIRSDTAPNLHRQLEQ